MQGLFKFVSTIFLVGKICCALELGNLLQIYPDTFKNVSELISSAGYPVENYIVQTTDGYLLSVQRIPCGIEKLPDEAGKRPAVLLMHGVFGDSIIFVWDGPGKSLGFILADNGYDVWMGNVRGNTYSRRHVKLTPDQNEFWDFSLDEKAAYDLPAIIDFILDKTGQKSLSYVGYSEGNTIAFMLLSQSPLYNRKTNLLAAYGPVAYFTGDKGLDSFLLNISVFIEPIYKQIGFVKLFSRKVFTTMISVFVCGTPLRFLCKGLFSSAFGCDPSQLNMTKITMYFNGYFAGDSMKTGLQFGQIKSSKKFQMYDYHEHNQEYYDQSTPPVYDLSKITTPVALYTGLGDTLADNQDVGILRRKIKSIVEDYIVPDIRFVHGDFAFGTEAACLVHKKLVSTLNKYT